MQRKNSEVELNQKQIAILQVAEKLFSENGFDGTSVRQIAKEADINIAMISYYFGSKEKLLEALLFYRGSDFKMQIETILYNENHGYLEKIDQVVEMVVRRIHNNRRIYKIVHFEFSNLGRTIDFENYINFKKQNFQILERFIQEGQEAGVFSKNVNIPLIKTTILGSYFNLYYNKKFFQAMHNLQDQFNFEEYVEKELIPHIQQTIKALLTYEV